MLTSTTLIESHSGPVFDVPRGHSATSLKSVPSQVGHITTTTYQKPHLVTFVLAAQPPIMLTLDLHAIGV